MASFAVLYVHINAHIQHWHFGILMWLVFSFSSYHCFFRSLLTRDSGTMSLTRGTQPASYCAGCYRSCGNTCLIIVVQSLSHVCLWPLLLTISWSLLKLMRIESVMQPSHPLLPPSPPAFNLSQHQGLFQWVSSLHQIATVLELQLQHYPSSEYSGLISFRVDWFDLLTVKGTLKSILQHHSSKASVLWCSAFFMVQLSQPYMAIGKIIALTIETLSQSDVSDF